MFKRLISHSYIPALLTYIFLVLLSGGLSARATGPVICLVPSGTYPTIESAVDDSLCEIINIAAGTFFERVTINRSLEMIGKGSGKTIIDGIAGGSVFTISGPAVSLADLAITNGSAVSGGGVHHESGNLVLDRCRVFENNASGGGGGIFNKSGNLIISSSSVDKNTADTGGGIFSEAGTLDISGSMIGNNESDFHAGGLFNGMDSQATLTRVSVKDNTCYVDGGGLFNAGLMTINNSAITGNKSTDYSGGAIRVENGTVYINNSTISGNKSSLGGPVDISGGTARINSSTVTKNEGSPAVDQYNGDIRIKNSIISGNIGKDCGGKINSDGYNLIGDPSNCDYRSDVGDILNTPANLGGLQGSPAYHPLLLGPGINAGNPNGCTNHLGQLLDTDQRGLPRIGRCDMGAIEFQGQIQQAFLPLTADVGCLDFYDDFSDSRSGWPVGEDEYVKFGYNNGEYQVQSKRADYLYLFESPACYRDAYVAQADARWESAPGLAYGLIFSVRGDFDQYYLFAVNTEYQVFWLDYRGPDGWQTLIEIRETPAIKKDQVQNELKVKREGDKIILVINDAVVASTNDGKIRELGGAGVFSVPYQDRDESDARFDNFVFRGLVGASVVQREAGPADGLKFSLEKLDLQWRNAAP